MRRFNMDLVELAGLDDEGLRNAVKAMSEEELNEIVKRLVPSVRFSSVLANRNRSAQSGDGGTARIIKACSEESQRRTSAKRAQTQDRGL
jgi:hypothetical protein